MRVGGFVVIKQYLFALCSFDSVSKNMAQRGLKEWQGSCGSRSGSVFPAFLQVVTRQTLILRAENTLLWGQPLRTATARWVANIKTFQRFYFGKKLQYGNAAC